MLRKLEILVLVMASLAMFTGSAQAAKAGDTYGGIQYASLTAESEDGFDDLDLAMIVGRFGRFINENFSVEGRIGIGVKDDSVSETLPAPFGDVEISVDIENAIGVYAMGHLPVGDNGSFYGFIGYTRSEVKVELTSSILGEDSDTDTDSDTSYGAGYDYKVSNSASVGVEYTVYDDDTEALSLGASFFF